MKWKVVLTIAVVIGVITLVFEFVIPRLQDYRYRQMQNDLAEKLGVKIEDYPYEKSFPMSYFYSILKPGTDISEVHKIVIGYEKVFRCYKRWEIYYYFSSDDSKALRFEIFYDDLGKFDELRGEDENSRSISVDDCEDGLLEATK